jgi:cyanophycinase
VSIWSIFTQLPANAPRLPDFLPQFLPWTQALAPQRPFLPAQGLLLPMGGGYAEVLPGVAHTLFERAPGNCAHVTVVPASFSTDARAIAGRERGQNLADAERRRQAIEASLQAAAPEGRTCRVRLAPIFVRKDAEDWANLRFFGREVDAVFLLGGDQAVAMGVLHGTPVERALRNLYRRGGIIAGTSAGAGMQSRTMLAGFRERYNVHNSLHVGATAVWNQAEARGLAFGVRGAIFDQHFFQRGRLGRLLEAITQPGAPGLGVGIDAYTGVRVHGGAELRDVFGLYSVAVLDAATYDAANAGTPRPGGVGGARPHPRGRRQGTVSARNVLLHLLGPGSYRYDLHSRRHSLAPLPQPTTLGSRQFDGLKLPPGAGPLFLCGGIDGGDDSPARRSDAAWQQFAACGGLEQGAAVIAPEAAAVDAVVLAQARQAWLDGAPVWLEGAAAAQAGAHFCVGAAPQTLGDPETLTADEAAQIAAERALLRGNVAVGKGLALLPAAFEPRVLENSAWGRLTALAYAHPEQPAFALGANTTLILTEEGAQAWGSEAVIALDLRAATLAEGENGALVVANALLDVFAPGECVTPQGFTPAVDLAPSYLHGVPCAEGSPLFWR